MAHILKNQPQHKWHSIDKPLSELTMLPKHKRTYINANEGVGCPSSCRRHMCKFKILPKLIDVAIVDLINARALKEPSGIVDVIKQLLNKIADY